MTYLGGQHIVHGKDINLRSEGVRRLDLSTNQLSAVNLSQLLDMSARSDGALESHVARGTESAEIRLFVIGSKDSVFYASSDKAVGLSVHRFGAEGGSNHEHLPAAGLLTDNGFSCGTPVQNLHLHRGVLLRAKSFSILAIVIHARLAILRAVDSVPLAELDLAELVQLVHLPAHKRVKVGVRIRRHEAASPVDTRAKGVVIGDGDGREVSQPVQRVRKLLDFGARDVDGLHDLELVGQPS